MLFSFVFFFKQKTAYEMRISDSSSDVCSSDLVNARCRHALTRSFPMRPTITAFESSPNRGRGLARDMRVRWAFEEVGQPYDVHQIGRASCRERVCQYV